MFSKCLELTGLGLIAWGLALSVSAAAGIIFAGASIVLVGGVTDDAAVGMALGRGAGWLRYAWHRQVLRESGVEVPSRQTKVADGLVRCDCGGEENCPLCMGLGFIPDPAYREGRSPQPPIQVPPDVQARAAHMAQQRTERSRLHDRTPALSQHPAKEFEDGRNV